jgi:hypothetical protein
MVGYEHGYLNAIAGLGGARTGVPRKPYGPLPDAAMVDLKIAAAALQDLEADL